MPRLKRSWTKSTIFARHLDILAQHRKLHLERTQIEVSANDIGDERYQHDIAGGDCRVDIVLRGLDAAPVLAENIELPGGIEAGEVDHLRHAGSVFGGDESLRSAAAREIAAGAPAAAGGPLGRGQRGADDDEFLGARLLQAVQGDFERRAGGERALDQRVELAVVQQAPPLRRLKRTIAVTIARRIERRRCRGEMVRQRRRRRKIIGTDRARGQGRANESAENGGAVSRRAAVEAIAATTPKFCQPQHGPVHSNSPTRRGS